MAGSMIDVVVGAAGPCELPHGVDVPDIASWHHAVSFGDGGTATATGGSATLRHTYDSRGTYEIRDDVSCSPCQSVFSLGYGSLTISVCEIRAVKSYADVTSCPRLLQSDADYDINGCTGGPDSIGDVIFGTVQGDIPVGSEAMVEDLPCNQHDLCYETCGSNLVVRHVSILGYSLLSLVRASAVVKFQSTPV